MRIVKSRRLRWAGHVARMGNEKRDMETACRKTRGEAPRRQAKNEVWENNINHDLRQVNYKGDVWKTLAEDREVWRAYVHAVMNLRVR